MTQFSTLWLCCAPKREPAPFPFARRAGISLDHWSYSGLRKFVRQIVEAHREENREHDLRVGLVPSWPRPSRRRGWPLGNWCIANALGSEFFEQADASP